MNGSTWIDEGARSSRGNKIIKPHTRCVKVSPATARSEHFIPAPKQQVICRVHLCSKARPTLALSFCLAHVQNLTSHLSVKNSTSNYIYIYIYSHQHSKLHHFRPQARKKVGRGSKNVSTLETKNWLRIHCCAFEKARILLLWLLVSPCFSRQCFMCLWSADGSARWFLSALVSATATDEALHWVCRLDLLQETPVAPWPPRVHAEALLTRKPCASLRALRTARVLWRLRVM